MPHFGNWYLFFVSKETWTKIKFQPSSNQKVFGFSVWWLNWQIDYSVLCTANGFFPLSVKCTMWLGGLFFPRAEVRHDRLDETCGASCHRSWCILACSNANNVVPTRACVTHGFLCVIQSQSANRKKKLQKKFLKKKNKIQNSCHFFLNFFFFWCYMTFHSFSTPARSIKIRCSS